MLAKLAYQLILQERERELVSTFRGRAHHKMDAKGRVALPAKYRTRLAGSHLVLVNGRDNCLWLMTEDEYVKLTAELTVPELSAQLDQRRALLQEVFISGAEDVEVDSAGRIRIPAHMRTYASLSKEVTFAGKGPRLELWDGEKYDARLANLSLEDAFNPPAPDTTQDI